ncbi:MAG TPA: hypothetical protein VF447_14835 [Terriglobales bacterium]
MTPLHIMIRRMQRLPAAHRIAHIKSLLSVEKPYSQRRCELEDMLQVEVLKQLRKEIRAA